MGEVEALRSLGYTVNGLLFNADDDYRREIIHRVARSLEPSHVERAVALAQKYNMEPLEVWLQHASVSLAADPPRNPAPPPPPPPPQPSTDAASTATAHQRIREVLWPELKGSQHNALIIYFTLLKNVDEKTPINGLTPAEHIKLLKKAKAASNELDYKLLLEQPSAERFAAHILNIIKPENVGIVTKFLRSLPPAFKLPVSVNRLYTKWLTKHFFSVGVNAPSKKWMQQYRQCASYFNKLSKDDLVQFVADTCFSDEAIERVSAGTRNLMIMQAVDYCQQEQENDFKFNKNEQTWAQVGQELTRWARFLENFHSTPIQNLIDNSGVPRNEIWPEIEKSHGEAEAIVSCAGKLVMAGDVRVAALSTLLQCLHVDADPPRVFQHIITHMLHDADAAHTLCTRLTQYHKDGVKFTEELLESTLQKATLFGLPPHKQVGLLSLSQRAKVHDSHDMMKMAEFSAELLRNEWRNSEHKEYTDGLTGSYLMNEEGRREAFTKFMLLANSWQQLRLLVDVINCWPPTRTSELRSLHCEYLKFLLGNVGDEKDTLVLIKLLMKRGIFVDEEIDYIIQDIPSQLVLLVIWVILLNKGDDTDGRILNLVHEDKEYLQQLEEIDNDLIKELLDHNMFLLLVSTPIYPHIINYILTMEIPGEELEPIQYTTEWAITELLEANFMAEAGHLRMVTLRVPASLLGFNQSVLYYKDIINKK